LRIIFLSNSFCIPIFSLYSFNTTVAAASTTLFSREPLRRWKHQQIFCFWFVVVCPCCWVPCSPLPCSTKRMPNQHRDGAGGTDPPRMLLLHCSFRSMELGEYEICTGSSRFCEALSIVADAEPYVSPNVFLRPGT